MPEIEYRYKMVECEKQELREMIKNFDFKFNIEDAAKYGDEDPNEKRLDLIIDWVNKLIQEAFSVGYKEGVKVFPSAIEFKK